MIRAQVSMTQSAGHYDVTLSGDGFRSTFRFYGTAPEIRALLEDIRKRLDHEEASQVEMDAELPKRRSMRLTPPRVR